MLADPTHSHPSNTQTTRALSAALISASPTPLSTSRSLLCVAGGALADRGVRLTTIDLADLPSAALLGRVPSERVGQAVAAVEGADIVVVASPIERGSYAGPLKVFFDLLPADALRGGVGVAIATGGSVAHALALDHAFRPLLASHGGVVVPTNVYATDDQFAAGYADDAAVERVEQAIEESVTLAQALCVPSVVPQPALVA